MNNTDKLCISSHIGTLDCQPLRTIH